MFLLMEELRPHIIIEWLDTIYIWSCHNCTAVLYCIGDHYHCLQNSQVRLGKTVESFSCLTAYTAPSSMIKAIQEGGSFQFSSACFLYVVWPWCTVSSAISSYQQVLIGNWEQQQKCIVFWRLLGHTLKVMKRKELHSFMVAFPGTETSKSEFTTASLETFPAIWLSPSLELLTKVTATWIPPTK